MYVSTKCTSSHPEDFEVPLNNQSQDLMYNPQNFEINCRTKHDTGVYFYCSFLLRTPCFVSATTKIS